MGLLIVLLDIFLDMSLYMLIGMILAGILHAALNKDFVAKHLGKGSRFSSVKAAMLGVPLPLCSCGVIPTAAYLGKNGADTSAAMAFLISTPQTGIDSIIATAGMMGAVFAVYRPLAAFISGAAGGAIIQKLAGADSRHTQSEAENCSHGGCGCDEGCGESALSGSEGACEYGCKESCRGCGASETKPALAGKLMGIIRYAFIDFMDDIALHFVIGVVVAAVITLIIPEGFFSGLLIGSGIGGMLLMLLIGLPMYICSTSSIPIALAFMAKGLSPGAAFVFLFAGPATNAASLAVLVKVFGKKTVAAYVAVTCAFALVFGLILDVLTGWFSLPMPAAGTGQSAEETGLISVIAGILFGAILIRSLIVKLIRTIRDKRALRCKI